MLTIVRRSAAQMFFSAGFFPAQHLKRFRAAAQAITALFVCLPLANAVVIRGTVTDPLGAVVVGARVQLIQGKSNAAVVFFKQKTAYEIRSTGDGRFVLLTSAATFTP